MSCLCETVNSNDFLLPYCKTLLAKMTTNELHCLKYEQQQQCSQQLHYSYMNFAYNILAISCLSFRKCQDLGL